MIPDRSFDTKMRADTEEALDADSDAVDVAGDDEDGNGDITDLVNTPALQVFDKAMRGKFGWFHSLLFLP